MTAPLDALVPLTRTRSQYSPRSREHLLSWSAATLTRSDGAVLLQLRSRASEEASRHGIAGTLIKVEKQRICTFRGQRPDKRHDAVGIGL
jgi:hypothetical protein